MGQKRSDLDTIPMCRTHHDYQHQVGWPAFIRKYQLDIPELLKALTEKPRFEIVEQRFLPPRYNATYRSEEFALLSAALGPEASLRYAKAMCREHLIDTLFRPLVERQRHAG